jgi:hypothetical protein
MGYTEDIEPVRRCGTPFVDEISHEYWEYKNGIRRKIMARTLNSGEHQLAFSRGVNYVMGENTRFAQFVFRSLLRFNRGDWGDVDKEDWKRNDEALDALNTGWDGRILAGYTLNELPKIWIMRNTAMEDGTQAITVIFPDEY